MKIIEKNAGQKIDYELNGTKLSFADGEGSLTTGRGLYYAAQVEIPPREYDEEIIPAPVSESGEADEGEDTGGMDGQRERVERTPRPLDTDGVVLSLFAVDGIVIY